MQVENESQRYRRFGEIPVMLPLPGVRDSGIPSAITGSDQKPAAMLSRFPIRNLRPGRVQNRR
jgi:hypothetical protein